MDGTSTVGSITGSTAPMALQTRWACGDVVGRATELSAVRQELGTARKGLLAAVTFEGEPGIGKSRLMVAAAEMAADQGFVTIAVTADEELRGPFLVARSIFADRSAREVADGAAAADLQAALDAISGRDDPGLDTLSPDEKLLRAFDLGAVAFRTLTSHTPVTLLIDDLQWADRDSVRMLRYIVRSVAGSPLFLVLAVRPEEMEDSEAAPLLADMERMGLVRRLRIGRMNQTESAEMLAGVLGGELDVTSAATMHAQAEGVPFILEEVARTYRDAGLVQQIDGVWTLAKNADRLVPSAVRTLIQRRAAHMPEATRAVLGEGAVLGRSFSLQDLQAVKERLGDPDVTDVTGLAELLTPAVTAGLLIELPQAAAADYRFAHEQVRGFAADALNPPRRRAIHGALVDLLTIGAEPSPESLPLLARHALAAGDAERAARFSIDAAQAALVARAPEEVLRTVELALPSATAPGDRVALLTARDDALEMLRRSSDRIEGLTELTALAEALGDRHLELDAMLRRAGALRLSGQEERATQLAEQVRTRATEQRDRRAELAACLELGQGHVGKPLGESYAPSSKEVDLDRAEEAYRCAADLADELGDLPALAAATRELGVLANARSRAWFIEFLMEHGPGPILARLAAGEDLDEMIATLPVAPLFQQATAHFERAIALFEELGDRRGLMSSIIGMAYLRFGADIHLQGSAKRIEEIRHLSTQLLSMSRESERDKAAAQMLYGVHVFARAKVVPDLALSRGVEAHASARLLGDRSLEFVAAGGVAMVHLELGDLPEAERWVDHAAAAAAAAPTPFKAAQLAQWRGTCFAAAGEAVQMRRELERAVELATSQGRPAARCEALALLALHAAQLGAAQDDDLLLALAERSADEARAIARSLPGHPLWGARADAATVGIALARDETDRAAQAAREAVATLVASDVEDLNLDIRLPVARGILAGGTEPEREHVRQELRMALWMVAQRILDEDVRVRWFLGPTGRQLTELAGPLEAPATPADPRSDDLGPHDARLLRLLVEGRTNRQIADALGIEETQVVRELTELYARIGTGSRAEATTFAFRERVV